ncbi:MAG: phage tail tape measure protein [Myxococcota bacterium]
MARTVRDLLVRITGEGADLEKELNSTIRNLDAVGRRAERVGRDLTFKFTAPAVAAGAAATKMATDFDKEMTKIVTLVGVAEDQVNDWRAALLQMGPEIGRSPRELARALFVITSAGERGANALEILERAAKASASGLGDTAEIARTVTAAMQAYSDMGLTAERATDILVATVREGNLEASDLAGSLGRVLGVAANVGVTFDEVGGFVATFTRLGVSAEEAVVALRGALNVLQRPTDGARDALQGMGMSIEGLRISIAERGLSRTLVDLVQRAEETGVEIAAVIPNVRALSGVLGTAGVQGEQFEKIVDDVGDSVGILDDAFERVQETPAQTFAQLRASVEALAISVGDALAPTLNEVLRSLLPVLRTLREVDAETVQSTARVVALVAAIGPLIFLAGSAARTVSQLANTLLLARTAGVALGSALLPGAALIVGLGLLAKGLVQSRLEAVRTGIAMAQLRSEILALGDAERTEVGIEAALGIIETERALEEARERLQQELDQAGRRDPLRTEFDMSILTPSAREAAEEVERLEGELAELRTRLDAVNEGKRRAAQAAEEMEDAQAEAEARAQELIDRFEGLSDNAEAAGESMREPSEVLEDLEDKLAIANQLGEVSGAFDANRLAATAYQSALQELIESGLDPTDQRVRRVAADFEELRTRMEGQNSVLDELQDRLAVASQLGEVAGDTFDAQALKVAAYEAALRALVEQGMDPMDPAVQEIAASLRALRIEIDEGARATEDLTDAKRVYAMLVSQTRTPAEELAQTVAAMNLLFREGVIDIEEWNAAIDAARERFAESTDAAAEAGAAWEDQFASAVVSATGQVSLSFRSMARDILQQIARVIARLLVMRAMMALLQPFAGTGGLGGALFSAFSAPFVPNRQHGGPIDPGRPYIVGEAGPELIVPSRSGTVIPAGALGGSGGPSASQVAARILEQVGPPPNTSPEVAATADWHRRLFGLLVLDARDRGVDV